MKPINVLVIADELIPRLGLKHLLTAQEAFALIADVGSEEAVRTATSLRADVVILLAEAVRRSCVQLVHSLHCEVPDTGIVVLGRNAVSAGHLLGAGALGYVSLTAPQELFTAIQEASNGRRYLDSSLRDTLCELVARRAASGKVLSRREQEVLRMFAYGYTTKDIVAALGIGRKSIETYRARIYEKQGLRTRADIVRYARETGIFNDPTEQAF
jgi:two-component system, NarL family, response regulator NreC